MNLASHLKDINDREWGSPRCQSIDPTGRFQCSGRVNHSGAGHGGPHPHDVGLPSWRDFRLVEHHTWEDDSVPTGGPVGDLPLVDPADPRGLAVFGPLDEYEQERAEDEWKGKVAATWAVVAVGLALVAAIVGLVWWLT